MSDPTFILVPMTTNQPELNHLKDYLAKRDVDAVVLRGSKQGIEIIQPKGNQSKPVSPKAICLYCGRANVHSSFECVKCGAPLLE